ncbi:MAG: hypothetical protein IPH45_04155 [Bacteroidales bacterium]|nr:hypothetical protein [Bacteroidales bacterium]
MKNSLKYIILFMSILFTLSSVRVSGPILNYILHYSDYVNECQKVHFHSDHHNGQCMLEKELALQGNSTSGKDISSLKLHIVSDWCLQFRNPCMDPVEGQLFLFQNQKEPILENPISILVPPPQA